MTVLLTMDLPVSREIVEAISEEVGVNETPPDGLLVHVITETDDGVHVVDVWETAEQFNEFRDSRLLPAVGKVFAAAGIPVPDPLPEAHATDAFDVVVGNSQRA